MTFRTVSMQGTQLSANERARIAFQQQIRSSFMHPVLQQQVEQTLQILEVRKEQGAKPEKVWFDDFKSTGTPSIAEWMGF